MPFRVDNTASIWYNDCAFKRNASKEETGVATMGKLSFLSFRELRASTARINDILSGDGKIVVTNQGKPAAIMLQVSESTLEETLAMINQLRLARAINAIRLGAQQSGASELTADEIHEEIAQSRQARRERQAKRGDDA
jgi:PHD/YefM family antitoxin component YafN of YafNO toxin-antitoxin module